MSEHFSPGVVRFLEEFEKVAEQVEWFVDVECGNRPAIRGDAHDPTLGTYHCVNSWLATTMGHKHMNGTPLNAGNGYCLDIPGITRAELREIADASDGEDHHNQEIRAELLRIIGVSAFDAELAMMEAEAYALVEPVDFDYSGAFEEL